MQELGDAKSQVVTLQAELADVQHQLRDKESQLLESIRQRDQRTSQMEAEHQEVLAGMQLALSEATERVQHQIDHASRDRQELMSQHERLLDEAHAHNRLVTQELEQVKQEYNLLRDEERTLREQTDKLKSEVHSAERAVDALEKEHKSVVDQASHWCRRKDEEIEVRPRLRCIRHLIHNTA
jgi:chromosome segregation ATPase